MEEAAALEAELKQQLEEQRESLAEVEQMLALDPSAEEVQQLHAQLAEAVQQLTTALLDLKKQRLTMEVEALHADPGPTGANTSAAAAAVTDITPADGAAADSVAAAAAFYFFSDGRRHRELAGASSSGGDDSGSSSTSGSGESSGSESGSEVSSASDDEGEGHRGLGLGASSSVLDHARAAAEAGPQQDTVRLAGWEDHSRGIASKLLAKLGYVAGTGLGRSGEGIVEPVTAELLPKQRGLGHQRKHHKHRHGHKHTAEGGEGGAAGDGGEGERKSKKRQRGGERSRRRRHAQAARAARERGADERAAAEAAGEEPGLFGFLNSLGQSSEAAEKLRTALGEPQVQMPARPGSGSGSGARGPGGGSGAGGSGSGGAAATRKGLAAHADAIGAAKAKVQQLQEMAARNAGNAGLSSQIRSKLAEAQRELEALRSTARAAHKSVNDKEAARRWVKF